ncbi:MAG: hypothetical protein B7Z23_03615, partial [Pseudomonadales bacterium 32-61-5]
FALLALGVPVAYSLLGASIATFLALDIPLVVVFQRLAAGYQCVEGKTVAVGWATERYGRNTQNKSFGVAD